MRSVNVVFPESMLAVQRISLLFQACGRNEPVATHCALIPTFRSLVNLAVSFSFSLNIGGNGSVLFGAVSAESASPAVLLELEKSRIDDWARQNAFSCLLLVTELIVRLVQRVHEQAGAIAVRSAGVWRAAVDGPRDDKRARSLQVDIKSPSLALWQPLLDRRCPIAYILARSESSRTIR